MASNISGDSITVGGTVTANSFTGDGSQLTGIASPYAPCKAYKFHHTGTSTCGSGNAVVIKQFPAQTIQAGKNVDMYLRVPARNDDTSWGGLYVQINVQVNEGTWYNLGNSGYDGNVMEYGQSISTSHHHKLLDFIANAGVSSSSTYTVRFEVTGRSYNGTTTINGSHDINDTGDNLGSRGGLASWGSNDNFMTLILREVDR